jgi:dCMP deaminase
MDWHEYFINLSYEIAKKSKDRSSKVGCVMVGPDNEIRSTGYNNFPRGMDDTIESRHERPEKYEWTEHAERNAIYNAARMGTALKGCRSYQQWYPCPDCARAIVQAGIIEVIVDDRDDNPWKSEEYIERWGDRMKISLQILTECGVKVTHWS